MQDFSNGGDAPKIQDVFVIAFYDPKTGRIAHTHTSVVFEGGRKISEQEARKIGESRAIQRGHKIKQLRVAVSNKIEHSMVPQMIDLTKKTFKKKPIPRTLLNKIGSTRK